MTRLVPTRLHFPDFCSKQPFNVLNYTDLLASVLEDGIEEISRHYKTIDTLAGFDFLKTLQWRPKPQKYYTKN